MNDQPKVLIADDEKAINSIFAKKLKKKGFIVTAVDNGEMAIQTIENQKFDFDVVILDMKMPKKDGIEVLKVIEVKSHQTQVLVITAYKADYEEKISRYKCVFGIYPKPLGSNIAITDLVNQAIEKQKKQLQEKVESVLIKVGTKTLSLIDPFDFPSSDKKYLGLETYRRLYKYLDDNYSEWINEQFKETGANTLVFCNHKKVLESKTPYVPLDKIKEIEASEQKICYVVGRDIIEETGKVGISRWSLIYDDDSYPTVPIYMGKKDCDEEKLFDEKNKIENADFDTGNPSILAFDDKFREALGEEPGVYQGRTIKYPLQGITISYDAYQNTVKIGVINYSDGYGYDCKEFEVLFVPDWDKSLFIKIGTSPNRKAFVGRSLWSPGKLQFSLTMDPISKTSTTQVPMKKEK